MSQRTAKRIADPYKDLAFIDRRAPRFNQIVVALVTGAALLTGAWWLVAVMAAQLVIGLTLGRRWCLTCLFYFEVIQPLIGEGDLEDSRPPRFANLVGALFLTSASLCFLLGLTVVGVVLTAMVFSLASLAAVSGVCVGCLMHRLIYGECQTCEVPSRN